MSHILPKLLPQALIKSFLRRKARMHETPVDRYEVRIASTVREYEDAFSLLHIAYAYQGIESIDGATMRITAQHVLPESTVFVAYEGDAIVGTMTVTLDSPAGLPLDKDYRDQLDALRQQGRRMVEYGSLAVVEKCWHTGVTNLINMAAHWWSLHVLKATDCVIGINPKAALWYDAVYSFKPLGPAQHHAELMAPVIGLRQDLHQARSFLKRHYTRPMGHGVAVGEVFDSLDLPCVTIPRHIALEDHTRWKMPREVFQELFIRRSDRLDSLDPAVREYLEEWRSPHTLHEVVAAA